MRKRLTLIVFLLVTVFCSSLAWAEVFQKGNWEIGLAADIRSVRLHSSGVPEKVKQEANNPSITNPYSGRRFDKSMIGTYDPTERFGFFEGGLYGKYTFPVKHRLRPYLRLELQYPFSASTHKGEYGEGYTYERVLGSGVDYVRYIYGIEYKYLLYLEPEAGLSYVKKDNFSLSFGVGYQQLKLTYYKGLEAWGDPENLQKLDTSRHNLFNSKLNFTKYFDDFIVSVEPSYTIGNGISGYAFAIQLGWKF